MGGRVGEWEGSSITEIALKGMRITIAAVGRLRPGPERELQHRYMERIAWQVDVREVVEKRRLSPSELKRREAGLLAAACPAGAILVALDRGGKEFSSEDFAQRLGIWRDEGVAELAFVIGGAEGLDHGIVKRARLVISLGAMTWPHMMVRAMLLEQIYRAQQILAGHPYHRGRRGGTGGRHMASIRVSR